MLARSNLTTPVGINYSIAITDSTTGATTTQGIGPITGDTWNLASFAPSTVQTAPPAAFVIGPAGSPGAPGAPGPPGVLTSNSGATIGGQATVNSDIVTLGGLHVDAAPTTSNLNTQGFNLAWNLVNGTGITTFLNNHGGGSSEGFVFQENDAGGTPVNAPITAAAGTFSGLITAAYGLAVTGYNFTNSSGAEELGSQTTAGNAYHDFHTSGSSNDYDSRILASGGTPGTSGAGNMQILAANLGLPAATTIGGNGVCTSAGGANCPAGSGGVASGSQYAVQTAAASAGGATTSDPEVVIDPTSHSLIAAAPRLNIRDPLFATGWTIGSTTVASCAGVDGNTSGAADPMHTYYSECAIMSAYKYSVAWAAAHPGIGYPILYAPAGNYKIKSTTTSAVLQFAQPVGIEGDSTDATGFDNSASPSGDAIFYTGSGACYGGAEYCSIVLRNFHITGGGHATTGGGITSLNGINLFVNHVVVTNVGGQSVNLQASTERGHFEDFDIQHGSVSLNMSHNTNEDYFDRVNVIDPGQDASGYVYSPTNCPGGTCHTSGAWYPEQRSTVYLNGDNIDMQNFSIKSLQYLSGIDWNGTSAATTLRHMYCEGNPNGGGTPRMNHCVQAIGASELGHTTTAMTTSSTTVGVDDAIWHRAYINDPAFVSSLIGTTARIVPCDFLANSTAASTCSGFSGFTRGQFEDVIVQGYAGDQLAHITVRATDGTTAQAWPVGAVIVDFTGSTYGTLTVAESHINTNNTDAYSSSFTPTSSDTGQMPLTGDSNCELEADVVVGPCPDGITLPFPGTPSVNNGPAYDSISSNVQFEGNSFYTGTNETAGVGWTKIPGNGSVSYAAGDESIQSGSYNIPAIQAGTYTNLDTNVQFVKWGTTTALGQMNDPGTRLLWNPAFGSFSASFIDSENNGALATQTISVNSSCAEWGQYTTTNHTAQRSCKYATGMSFDTWNGSAWVNVQNTTATAVTAAQPLYSNGGLMQGYLYSNPTSTAPISVPSSTRNITVWTTGTSGNYTLPSCSATSGNWEQDYWRLDSIPANTVTFSINSVQPEGGSFSGYASLAASTVILPVYGRVHFTCGFGFLGPYGSVLVDNFYGGPAAYAHTTVNTTNAGSTATLTASALSTDKSGVLTLTPSAATTAGAAMGTISFTSQARPPQACMVASPGFYGGAVSYSGGVATWTLTSTNVLTAGTAYPAAYGCQ